MRTQSRTTIWRGAILLTLALAVMFSVCSGTDLPHKPWLEKDWTQWTELDCNIVMGWESPWSHATEVPGYSMNGPRVSAANGTLVQLRSALPIRQALLRKLQLDSRYDKMKPDKKQAFDEAHTHDLDPIDQVRVYIVNSSFEPPPVGTVGGDRVLGPAPGTQAALRLADGTLVQPIQTNQVKYESGTSNSFEDQFEYLFPRTVAGNPLFSSTNSSLRIELGAPLVVDKKTHQVITQEFRDAGRWYQFKIANMMYKGKLEY
ncbi:MAG TPA: hypothetical protein VGZ48_02860 [Candidatus Acidoferrales bacterium]|jgi:hypothetical protein|nr:hypothetical protein [Candidatus Acidoferrales bacterium]